MSAVGDAFVALKNVMLLHDRVERLQKELEGLARTQDELGSAVLNIDRRVARLEGFIEGVSAASAQQAKLPKD